MLARGDARERGARLALGAGEQRHDLVGRQVAVGVRAAEIRHAVEKAALAGDVDDALHGAADDDDLTAAGLRRVGDGADARDVRGEGGDRDALRGVRDEASELFATSPSLGETPSRTTFVESQISASTPSSPRPRTEPPR